MKNIGGFVEIAWAIAELEELIRRKPRMSASFLRFVFEYNMKINMKIKERMSSFLNWNLEDPRLNNIDWMRAWDDVVLRRRQNIYFKTPKKPRRQILSLKAR